MNDVYIIDAVRSPLGQANGNLKTQTEVGLLSHLIRVVLERTGPFDLMALDAVLSSYSGSNTTNISRQALRSLQLPFSISGISSGTDFSGLQVLMEAYRQIKSGDAGMVVAAALDLEQGDKGQIADDVVERVANDWDIDRSSAENYAALSRNRYEKALSENLWDEEMVAVELEKDRLVSWIVNDEKVEDGFKAKQADGAAAILLGGKAALDRFELIPLAKIVCVATASVDPSIGGMAVVPAAKKALYRAGLEFKDIGLIELNDQAAAVSLAAARELRIEAERLNSRGSALSMGNPVATTGIRITTSLAHEMKRVEVKYGLAVCADVMGQAGAVVLELVPVS